MNDSVCHIGRVVVVTGAAGGIGAATCAVFASQGWRVFGIDRRTPGDGVLLDTLEGSGGAFVRADMSDPEAPRRVFSFVEDQAGMLHALVNNAAVQVCKPIAQTTAEEFDLVMASNIRSVFLSMQLAQPMLERTARDAEHDGTPAPAVVNVSSVHALVTSPDIAAYAASKGALLAFTRATALELGPMGIRVNAVLPGAVDTPMLHAGLSRTGTGARSSGAVSSIVTRLPERMSNSGRVDGGGAAVATRPQAGNAQPAIDADEAMYLKVRALGRSHPLGRVGKPEEIGRVIRFLADSNESSFITGQAIVADGGATARLSTE